MAIYHWSVKVINKRGGRSATAAAAYRSRQKIVDYKTGIIHDYTKKPGIDCTEILTPIAAINENAWMADRSALWNKVETVEKRKDAQLAREVEIAIPLELDRQQRIELVCEYIQKNFVERGMIADIFFHNFQTNNPHAHIMLTTRALETDERGVMSFGKKVREWNDRNLVGEWRKTWEETANKYLENAGYDVRIDSRSLAEQGITDRLPQIHLGANVAAMKARGIPTDRGEIYDRIAATNEQSRDRVETKCSGVQKK